jgi:hypothetical protein
MQFCFNLLTASYELECFRMAHVNCEHNTDCSPPGLTALIGCGAHSSTASDSKPGYFTSSKFTAGYDVTLLKLRTDSQRSNSRTGDSCRSKDLAVMSVFYSSNTVIVRLNLTRGMDAWLDFSVLVLSCVGTGQEVLQMHKNKVSKHRKWMDLDHTDL